MTEQPAPLRAWHDVVVSKDLSLLDTLLDESCVFRSPAIFKPQEGKALTTMYLSGALTVLGPTLRYVDEWFDEHSAVLEFEAEVDGSFVHGVDMMRWNADGKLTSFTVMLRPLRGLQAVIEQMRALLTANQPT